jgi:hypothetical protein
MRSHTDTPPLYDEFVNFLASGFTSQQIVDYRPSGEVQQRLSDLMVREKMGGLDDAEYQELNHYLQLEHIIRLAKARARMYLV